MHFTLRSRPVLVIWLLVLENVIHPARAALVYDPADITSPTVTIDSPAHNSTVGDPRIHVTGTAADDARLVSVQWRLNGSDWAAAQGAAAWTTTCSLVLGVNTIEARATDQAGNVSQLATLTLLYVPPTSELLSPPAIIGGACKALAIKGDLALLGEGTRLHLLDISDRARILPLGVIDLHEIPVDIAVSGDLAFVVAGGLHVIDISDAAHPRWRGGYRGSGLASTIALIDGQVYLGERYGQMLIIDAADPASPRLRAHLDTWVSDMALSGHLLYLAQSSSISVFDVTQPDQPSLIATPGLPAQQIFAEFMAVSGTRLLCAKNTYTGSSKQCLLTGYDMSDPANPVTFGSARFPGDNILDLQLVGDRLHIVDSSGALKIIDVASSTTFITSSTCPLGAPASHLAVASGHDYVAMNHGLRVVDAGRVVGAYETIGPVLGLAPAGDTLWTAGTARVSALNVANPAQPSRRSSLDLPGISGRIRLGGGRLIAPLLNSTLGCGAQVIDAADPGAPAWRCRLNTETSSIGEAALLGNVAVLYNNWPGDLFFYDLAATTPTLLNTFRFEDNESGMVNLEPIGSNLALSFGYWVFFLDCADPLHPVRGQIYSAAGITFPKPFSGVHYPAPYHLAVSGTRLILTHTAHPPVVLNAGNALDLAQLNELDPAPPYYQAAAGRTFAALAYSLDLNCTLSAIDMYAFSPHSGQLAKLGSMIVPTMPKRHPDRQNYWYPIAGDIQMAVEGCHFYIAGGELGLRVYELPNAASHWVGYE